MTLEVSCSCLLVAPNYHARPPTTLFKKACKKVLNPQLSHLNEAIFDPAQVLAHKTLRYNQMGIVLALPDCSVVKNLPANAGDAGAAVLIPGSGRSPGGRSGKPTPVFLPGESHGQRAAQSRTQLSTHTCTYSLACTNSTYLG